MSILALTWKVEDLVPPTERYIFNFNSKDELKKWHLYSDSEYGGIEVHMKKIKAVRSFCLVY